VPLLTADIFDRRRNNPERLLRTRNQPASNSRIIPTALEMTAVMMMLLLLMLML
jgi:hypothetical protein